MHIHVPEGRHAQGRSERRHRHVHGAGIRADDIPVSALAMTGEITLRGEVLPIGGLKEKLLAAAGW